MVPDHGQAGSGFPGTAELTLRHRMGRIERKEADRNMQDYRVETSISSDGSLVVKDLPFPPGERVEVIIRTHNSGERKGKTYPLRGKPVRYTDPFGSVAEEDWEALR